MCKAIERRNIVDLDRLMLLASTDAGARLALAREARRSGRSGLVCLDWLSGSSAQVLELGALYPIDAYPEPLRGLPSDLACVLWLLVRDGRFNEAEPPRRRLPSGVSVISVVKRHLSGRGTARGRLMEELPSNIPIFEIFPTHTTPRLLAVLHAVSPRGFFFEGIAGRFITTSRKKVSLHAIEDARPFSIAF